MSEVTATTGFLSVIMEMATQGLDVLDPMRDTVGRLEPVMFIGDERRVFEAARLLLDERKLPTPFNVARSGNLAPLIPARIKKTGEGLFGDLNSSVQAVLQQHAQSIMVSGLSLALERDRKGELDSARSLPYRRLSRPL